MSPDSSNTSNPRLSIYCGSEVRQIPLESTLTIGRSPDNTLVLEDARVSRRHACIERRGDFFYIRDLGSTNATRVNGERVQERRLEDGDTVSIGGARLVFHAGRQSERQSFPAARKWVRQPVVFIPGFAGSELYQGERRIWPMSAARFYTQMESLVDQEADIRAGNAIREVAVIPGLFKMDAYGSFIAYLEKSLGYRRNRDLLEFGWDWRHDIRLAARLLAQRIEQWLKGFPSPSPRITIIGHSCGCLVGRYYVEKLGGKERVSRMMLIGGPHQGTLKAFLALFSGQEAVPVEVGIRSRLRDLSRQLYPLYQILPHYPAVFDESGHPVNILEDERWLPPRFRPLLREGREFYRDLPDSGGVSRVCVLGYGQPTPLRARVTGNWWEDEKVVIEWGDGDGEVPTCSAVLENGEIHPVLQKHEGLASDTDVRARMGFELLKARR